MLGGLAAGVVDAAAGNDLHVGIGADVEIVVHQIGKAGLGHDDRNVEGLLLGAGGNVDVDTRLVLLALNDDIGGVGAALQLAVFADIVGALRNLFQIRDFLQQNLINAVHQQLTSSFI